MPLSCLIWLALSYWFLGVYFSWKLVITGSWYFQWTFFALCMIGSIGFDTMVFVLALHPFCFTWWSTARLLMVPALYLTLQPITFCGNYLQGIFLSIYRWPWNNYQLFFYTGSLASDSNLHDTFFRLGTSTTVWWLWNNLSSPIAMVSYLWTCETSVLPTKPLHCLVGLYRDIK